MTEILHAAQTHAAPRESALPRKRRWAAILARLRVWRTRRRTRRHLAELEPWMLRDIGIAPAEAQKELEKSFFRTGTVHDGWR